MLLKLYVVVMIAAAVYVVRRDNIQKDEDVASAKRLLISYIHR